MGWMVDMEEVCELSERIRYADTDQMGVVHHAKFLEYFEMGRTEYMRRRGLPYSEVERRGIYLVIVEAHLRYHKPAEYDNIVLIRTHLDRLGGAKIRFSYEVLDEDGTLLVSGYTVLGSVNRQGRAVRLPEWIKEALGGKKR